MTSPADIYVPPAFPPIEEKSLPSNVHVHFHFSMHETAEDFETVEPIIPTADLVALEMAGWTPRILKDINAAATNQDAAKYEFVRPRLENEFFRAYIDSLRKHKTPVTTFDASKRQFEQAGLRAPRENDLYVPGTVEQRLERISAILLSTLRLCVERDVIIVGNIGPVLYKYLEANPELGGDTPLTVLSTLGAEHRGVFEYLRGQPSVANQVSASEATNSVENTYLQPAFQHLLAGKPIPRNLLLHDMVLTFVNKITLPGELGDDKAICSGEAAFRRQKTTRDMIGITAREMILADIDHDASLREAIHYTLNQAPSNNQLRKIIRYVRKAKAEVQAQA